MRDKKAFFCDSFGCSPDNNVLSWAKSNKLHLFCNTYSYQDIHSKACGMFCIALFHYVKNKPKPNYNRLFKEDWLEKCNSFINLFEPNTEVNDGILFKYLKLHKIITA